MLGVAGGGIIGLAIINWPGPTPDLPVEAALAVAVAPAPNPPVAAPAKPVAPPLQGVPAPPQPSVASPPDTPMLTRDVIAQAQRDLARLGFKAGTPDGIIGKKTRVAVRAFQVAHSLPVDGELTLDLARTLASTR
jgi:localization factor PodJL